MRIGQNPAKMRGSPAYTPKRVGVASLTYVPVLEGYWREAPEVIRVHLASVRATSPGCDLCVFDNGSCPQVIDFLEAQWREGLIDWLCVSHHNLGKNGALNWIFSAMPNEYIGYSDSDILYRPGWLERSLEIFAAFEKAGMVSASPVFFDFLRGQGKTAQAIAATPGLEVRAVTPDPSVIDEYCDGINATPEQRQQFRQTRLQVAFNLQSGARAVTSATDMQFMLSKKVARQLVPLPIAGALTARDAIDIPRGIEDLGYWILSSDEHLVRHMGNTILGRAIPEIDAYLTRVSTASRPDHPPVMLPTGAKKRLFAWLQKLVDRSPGLRRRLVRVYDGLFGLLFEERR
jgi:hypothetical protein